MFPLWCATHSSKPVLAARLISEGSIYNAEKVTRMKLYRTQSCSLTFTILGYNFSDVLLPRTINGQSNYSGFCLDIREICFSDFRRKRNINT